VQAPRHRFNFVRSTALLSFACAATLLGLAAAASAATFTVNTTADADNRGCTVSLCSLRDAIDAATANTLMTNSIILPAGTYTLAGTELPPIADSGVDLRLIGAGARTTTISGNGASRIFEIDFGNVAISGVTVTDGSNTSTSGSPGGGAIAVVFGELSLTDVAVTDSVEMGGGGGGIYAGGPLNLDRVTVSGNKASTGGGGLELAGQTPLLINSTITGNSVDTTLPGTPSGATGSGGGVKVDTATIATLQNTTVAGNSLNPSGTVGTGGGIDLPPTDAVVYSDNSIVAANSPTDCDQHLTQIGPGPNLDEDSSCFTGNTNVHGSPLLEPLADNGGQTDTLALAAGSPAIGLAYAPSCPATDQRGVPHQAGAACDLGAYQTTPPFVATSPATSVSASTATLNGTANPDNQPTTAYFEYGTSASYGSQTAAQPVGWDYSAHTLAQSVTGLAPATTYHYRLVATSPFGTAVGADQSFVTATVRSSAKSPPRKPHVKLGRTRVSGLMFWIPLTCRAGSSCQGVATLVVRGRAHPKISFTIRGAHHRLIKLSLDRKARALLTRLHHVTVKVKVTLRSSGHAIQTVTRTVKLKR
jgi:CSLREA domain-containing protein